MPREHDFIEKTANPATRLTLAEEFQRMGLCGETILAHSALSSLGWVSGGAVALIQALMDAIRPRAIDSMVPGVRRSAYPAVSFCAWDVQAAAGGEHWLKVHAHES